MAKAKEFTLADRVRVRRETRESLRKALAKDLPPDEAGATVLAEMKAKYGLDLNWEKILEIILLLLDLFLASGES